MPYRLNRSASQPYLGIVPGLTFKFKRYKFGNILQYLARLSNIEQVMLIPPKYFLTPKIAELLQSIEASKEVINSISIPPEIETNIRRQSTLKSSLFSARVEGNSLTMDELIKRPSKDQKRLEVFNILKGLNQVYQRQNRDLTAKQLLELHGSVMNGLISGQELGSFRKDVGAIFNSAGIAIYLPPRPLQIPTLINKLITFVNSSKEGFIPIRACLAHYSFEKIHPFLDGNGRVGRLLLQAVLQKEGYGMKGLLPIEEYLDKHRASYYQALEDTEKDVTDYLEFMLEAIAQTAELSKKMVLEKQTLEASDYLLPRRAEILNIIKDHRLVTFNEIKRRFMAIPDRTLSYDLKKLQDAGLIKKLGTTKGVFYQII